MISSTRDRLRAVPLISAVILFTTLAGACRQTEKPSTTRTSESQVATRTVAVSVDGMICQVCAGRVKSALKAVNGVQDAEISLEKRNAVIRYDEATVRPDRLAHAITDLGYKAGVPTPLESR